MSQQPPDRPSEDRQPPPEQPTQPLPESGQQPPQQGQPPPWGPPGQQPQPGWGPPQPQPPTGQPTQPGWGQPPPPPPSGAKKPWYRRPLPIIGLIVAVLFVIGLIASGGDDTANVSDPATTEEPATTDEPPTTEEPATTEETSPSGPVQARVGETLSFEDSFGDHSADITVVRKKVSTGDEFNKPTNGRFVGLFVKVKAFQDGITVPEFYVVQKGRHYDSTCCTEGFEPDLNTYSDLNKSESTDGWLVFDVPSEHGTLHMKEFASERIQASWTF